MAEWNLSIEDAGLGAYLRREREERGTSIADVASSTRVRTFYIEKIEAEEFGDLPGVPICRGFIRAYATHIGVDADHVVQYYNNTVGAVSDDIDDKLAVKIRFSPVAFPKRSKLLLPIAVVVLFILGSGAFLWFVKGKTAQFGKLGGFTDRIKAVAQPAIKGLRKLNGSSKGRSTKAGASAGRTAAAPKISSQRGGIGGKPNARKFPGATKVSGSAKPAGPRSTRVAPNLPVPVKSLKSSNIKSSPSALGLRTASLPGKVETPAVRPKTEALLGLTIKAVEDTWLRIQVDSKESFEILLAGGSQKTWRGRGKFVLTVGNLAGTKIFLNDTAVALPQTASNVLREFVITKKMIELQQASSLRTVE